MVMEALVPGIDDGTQYCHPNCSVSDSYLRDIAAIVSYAGSVHGMQVLLSVWDSNAAW